MEFIQFHPTGMVWPPSVRGILVTEGVRGEGGILKNSEGKRFMFDDIPANYKDQTADTPEEGWRYVTGDKDARRPPELLTRDHVARCIVREVKEGRGSPHGGVFLDIASRRPADYIQRRLPSMYHQFKELADVDITKESMEVGPTCHYAMGGVRVDADSTATTVPGLFAAGEVAAGLHGANRLGGNSLSDLLVFGRRAGLYAAEYAKSFGGSVSINNNQLDQYAHDLLAPFEATGKENPYTIHSDLQQCMQELVGIIRVESELNQALEIIQRLRQRSRQVKVEGNRQYNPGWHLALDLHSLLTFAEAASLAAIERKESRGGHTRDDYPSTDAKFAKVNVVIRKTNGQMTLAQEPLPEIPGDLKALLEEKS